MCRAQPPSRSATSTGAPPPARRWRRASRAPTRRSCCPARRACRRRAARRSCDGPRWISHGARALVPAGAHADEQRRGCARAVGHRDVEVGAPGRVGARARTEGGAALTPGPRCSGSHAASTAAPPSGTSETPWGSRRPRSGLGTSPPGAARLGDVDEESRPRAAGSEEAVWASERAAAARKREGEAEGRRRRMLAERHTASGEVPGCRARRKMPLKSATGRPEARPTRASTRYRWGTRGSARCRAARTTR